VSRELFGEEGIAKLLLPPSRIVDMIGEQGIVKVSDPAVHTLLVADAQGRRTLIALNTKNSDLRNVTITIDGLKSGNVRTRFEDGRKPSATDGALHDDFGPISRHVYDLDGE